MSLVVPGRKPATGGRMTASRRNIRRNLADYAFATASLAILVVGIVFVNLDHSLTSRQILANLGLNLIASVIFAVIFSWLSGRVQERSLNESLEESFKAYSGEMTKTYKDFSVKLTATVAQVIRNSSRTRFTLRSTRRTPNTVTDSTST